MSRIIAASSCCPWLLSSSEELSLRNNVLMHGMPITQLVASGDTAPRRSRPTMSRGFAIHRGNGSRREAILFRHMYGCCGRSSVKVAQPPLSLARDHDSWDPPDHGTPGSY